MPLRFQLLIRLVVALFVSVMGFFPESIRSQELDTSFKTKSGGVIGWKNDTDWVADYPMASTATYHLTPAQGSELAHTVILQGTAETHFYGKKITYSLGTENFLLEGDGRIVQGDSTLIGPERVDYNKEKNLMILFGKPDTPARLHYIRAGGLPMDSTAIRINIYFEDNGGKRTVKMIEGKGNIDTRIPMGNSQPNREPAREASKRKLSKPK